MSELLTRGCFGWHCDDAERCRHHQRKGATTMAQLFFRVVHDDICPFFEEKESRALGQGAEPND